MMLWFILLVHTLVHKQRLFLNLNNFLSAQSKDEIFDSKG